MLSSDVNSETLDESSEQMEVFHYNTYLDQDRNQLLDRHEVFEWITDRHDPYGEAEVEAAHLMTSSDREPLVSLIDLL